MDSERLSTDTRTIRRGDVFFALKGERFDGHDFIGQAVRKGASKIVFSDERALKFKENGVVFTRVKDTLKAYGDRAALLRRKSRACVIAVTGSSGKTTVKEMIAHILSARFAVHKNAGTENNLIGVPKTILGLDGRHDALILELGTNRPGEIERLSKIARPDVAVVTCVAHSHLQGLGSIDGVREEKLSITRGLVEGGALWLNGDDPMLADARARGAKIRRVGIDNPAAEIRAQKVEAGERVSFSVDGHRFFLQCLGRHNVLNACLAIGVARGFGMNDAEIGRSLAEFRPVGGRLEIRRVGEIVFLDDTYNANPASFEAALNALAGFPAEGRRIVVAGDMLELGSETEPLHRRVGRAAVERKIDFLITAGERARAIADEARSAGLAAARVRTCRAAEEAAEALREIAEAGDAVLVKGSRGMKMERVIACFSPSYTR